MERKDVRRYSCLWLLAGCILLGNSVIGVRTSSSEEVKNLVKNPGVEEFDKAGRPVAWRWYNNLGLQPSEQDYFEVDGKTYAVLPIGKGGNTAKIVHHGEVAISLRQDNIEVEGGTLYLVSMKHIETPNFPRNLYVMIRQHDADGKDITGGTYYFATNVSPVTMWTTWSKEFKTKPNTATIALIICPGGKGTAWFDDISIVKVKENMSKN